MLPYINADPVLAKRLQDVGTATVMPLGAPIGTNRGLVTRDQIRIIIEQATVPVVVDAGLGAPSHAAEAMETRRRRGAGQHGDRDRRGSGADGAGVRGGGGGRPRGLGDRASRGRGPGGGDEPVDRVS